MGKKDIEIIEVNILVTRRWSENGMEKYELIKTDTILQEDELQEKVMMGTREITLRRYLFESIIPYFYNQPRKKIL
jgi:hypothetical protein